MKQIRIDIFISLLFACTNNLVAQKFNVQGVYYIISDTDKVNVTMPDTYRERLRLYSDYLVIPDSVIIGENVYCVCDIRDSFRGCTRLKNIRLPNTLQYIISMAFAGCKSLQQIELPDDITCIYGKAFSGCKSLRVVKMPAKLRIIKDSAFEGCIHLERLEIPKDVVLIGDYAFEGCKRLREIYVYSPIPPELETTDSTATIFSGVNKSVTIHVPKDTKTLYLSTAGWRDFDNYIDDL